MSKLKLYRTDQRRTFFLFTIILFVGALSSSFAPNPDDSHQVQEHLFKIERNTDLHQIHYKIRKSLKGDLDKEDPVYIYWIRVDKGTRKQELNFMEKKFAYGLNFYNMKDTQADFKFVSFEKRSFSIRRNSKGIYRVYTWSNSKYIELSKLYLRITGGSMMVPKITDITIHGIEVKSGLVVREVVKI